MSEWVPTREPWIVCAACKHGDFIACGPRHFDETMRPQVEAYIKAEIVRWMKVIAQANIRPD